MKYCSSFSSTYAESDVFIVLSWSTFVMVFVILCLFLWWHNWQERMREAQTRDNRILWINHYLVQRNSWAKRTRAGLSIVKRSIFPIICWRIEYQLSNPPACLDKDFFFFFFYPCNLGAWQIKLSSLESNKLNFKILKSS